MWSAKDSNQKRKWIPLTTDGTDLLISLTLLFWGKLGGQRFSLSPHWRSVQHLRESEERWELDSQWATNRNCTSHMNSPEQACITHQPPKGKQEKQWKWSENKQAT